MARGKNLGKLASKSAEYSVDRSDNMTSIRTAAISFLCLLALSVPASARDTFEEVRQTLQAYEQAWSKHDPSALAAFYFEPAMRVSKAGPVVRASRADQQAFFAGYLRAIIERGYDRSEWESLDGRLLDAQTALGSGVAVRYRADGSVLERVGLTYHLWKTVDGWKIFLSATHAPENVLRFQ
jgi:ketosteroid isomerase-like protein